MTEEERDRLREAYVDSGRRVRSRVSEKQATADHWAVTVRRNGEEVVTIESNSLAGREISPEDEKAIETAAHHLLSFIGRSPFLPITTVGASDGRLYRLNDRGLWEHADAG